MTTQPYTRVLSDPGRHLEIYSWPAMAAGDDGQVLALAFPLNIGALQTLGNFDTGNTTLSFEVSNDGTNWVTMNDNAGNAVESSAAGFWELSSGGLYFRPSVAGGGGNPNCILVAWE